MFSRTTGGENLRIPARIYTHNDNNTSSRGRSSRVIDHDYVEAVSDLYIYVRVALMGGFQSRRRQSMYSYSLYQVREISRDKRRKKDETTRGLPGDLPPLCCAAALLFAASGFVSEMAHSCTACSLHTPHIVVRSPYGMVQQWYGQQQQELLKQTYARVEKVPNGKEPKGYPGTTYCSYYVARSYTLYLVLGIL